MQLSQILKPTLGYKESPSFLINVEEENLFRDAFLAGLESLSKKDSIGKALQETKAAWEVLAERRTNSLYTKCRMVSETAS